MMEGDKLTKVSIYLTRHGESEGNVLSKNPHGHDFAPLDPFLEDGLTEVGKAQAEMLGSHLQNTPFHIAFASDYLRAKQTAHLIILENLTAIQLDVKTDERLREGGLAESEQHFESRIINFFNELIKDLQTNSVQDHQNVLIVSHAIAIRKLMFLLKRRPGDLGICSGWTDDSNNDLHYSEKLLKNGSYHKIRVEITQNTCTDNETNKSNIFGFLESAHCRKHFDLT